MSAESIAAKDWIEVPQAYYMAKAFVRNLDALPAGSYRVIVDVPPRVRGGTRVAQSSGQPMLDRLAREFAEDHAQQTAKLRELNQSRELRLPLLFNTPDWSKGMAETGKGQWQTPKPRYPDWAKANRFKGAGVIRILTGPDGRVRTAKMAISTGSRPLDIFITEFVLHKWSGPPNTSHLTAVQFKLN